MYSMSSNSASSKTKGSVSETFLLKNFQNFSLERSFQNKSDDLFMGHRQQRIGWRSGGKDEIVCGL